jgi:hypothetical protein
LERRWEVLVKMRELETNYRRFDNTPGTRKHKATELFNERHGPSALFSSAQDFLRDADFSGEILLDLLIKVASNSVFARTALIALEAAKSNLPTPRLNH